MTKSLSPDDHDDPEQAQILANQHFGDGNSGGSSEPTGTIHPDNTPEGQDGNTSKLPLVMGVIPSHTWMCIH